MARKWRYAQRASAPGEATAVGVSFGLRSRVEEAAPSDKAQASGAARLSAASASSHKKCQTKEDRMRIGRPHDWRCGAADARSRRFDDVLGWIRLNQALQLSLTARTSGKQRTSPMKRASKGEVLSRLHASASRRATFKSTTGKMATVLGHRHRALPRTHPTPKPVDTSSRLEDRQGP
jgi:hypothetical protein